jgi:hypothetical protein
MGKRSKQEPLLCEIHKLPHVVSEVTMRALMKTQFVERWDARASTGMQREER